MKDNECKEVRLNKIYSTQNISREVQLNKRKSWNDVKIKKHLFSIFQMTRYKKIAKHKKRKKKRNNQSPCLSVHHQSQHC